MAIIAAGAIINAFATRLLALLIVGLLGDSSWLAQAAGSKAAVALDDGGNVHINTTNADAKIFLNGVDVLATKQTVDRIEGTELPEIQRLLSMLVEKQSGPPLMIKTLEGGNVIHHVSVQLSPGSNAPVVVYRDFSEGDLKICFCSDLYCTMREIKTLDSEGNTGLWLSFALTPGTNAPVISYRRLGPNDLKVCICHDAYCTKTTIKTLDSQGDVGRMSSIALSPTSNAPIISYRDETKGDLKICFCTDALCSETTIRTLDSQGNVGAYTSLALISDTGAPVISYSDGTSLDLKLCICSDALCENRVIKTLDTNGNVGHHTSIALTPGTNRPVISYYDSTTTDLKLCICSDPACDATTIKTIHRTNDAVGKRTTLVLTPHTNAPVISHSDDTNDDILICICSDELCTESTIKRLDPASEAVTNYLTLVPGTNAPVVTYFDEGSGALKIAICGTATCD